VRHDDPLLPLLLILPLIDWTATVVLVTLARRRPRITFLVERAFAAVVVSIVTTVYALLALNTQGGFPVLAPEAALTVVRLLIIALGAAPLVWLTLYWRRR